MNVRPLKSFHADAQGFTAGLTGTIGVTVLTAAGATYRARQTTGISEQGTSTGCYRANLAGLPTTSAGNETPDYVLDWDDGSGNHAYEPVYVNTANDDTAELASAGIAV